MQRGDRSQALKESLRRLAAVAEGVHACAILDGEGFVIAAQPSDDRAAQLGALSASLAGTADSAMQRLGQGGLDRLLLEGQTGTLLCCRAGELNLALLLGKDASLAHCLFAAGKAKEEIEALLAQD